MSRPEDALGLRLVGHSDLGGCGDGMQVLRQADAIYVGHLGTSGMGTSILEVSDPSRPALVRQWEAPEGGHSHKVQVTDGLLLVNHEAFRGGDLRSPGMAVYSLEDPFDPRMIGFWESGGKGVHRIVWTGGRHAYLSAVPDGFDDRIWVIVDLEDPEKPVEVGRWWWPGMWRGGGERPDWPADEAPSVHHGLVEGDRAYVGLWDSGMVILDISDLSRPALVSRLSWSPGGNTHTCMPLPGRDLLVATDESLEPECREEPHMVRVIDVADEASPRVLAVCPVPEGDFCKRGLRFGAHNLHENRPGSYVSEQVAFATYFNAGLRVYDLTDPARPVEIAHYIPQTPPGQQAPQLNDLFVEASGLIWVTDRINGGVYCLEPDSGLAVRMEEARA